MLDEEDSGLVAVGGGDYLVTQPLKLAARMREIDCAVVTKAIADLGINPDAPPPWTV